MTDSSFDSIDILNDALPKASSEYVGQNVESLLKVIDEKSTIIDKKSEVIEEQRQRIKTLEEYLRLERARRFGASSE